MDLSIGFKGEETATTVLQVSNLQLQCIFLCLPCLQIESLMQTLCNNTLKLFASSLQKLLVLVLNEGLQWFQSLISKAAGFHTNHTKARLHFSHSSEVMHETDCTV